MPKAVAYYSCPRFQGVDAGTRLPVVAEAPIVAAPVEPEPVEAESV